MDDEEQTREGKESREKRNNGGERDCAHFTCNCKQTSTLSPPMCLFSHTLSPLAPGVEYLPTLNLRRADSHLPSPLGIASLSFGLG